MGKLKMLGSPLKRLPPAVRFLERPTAAEASRARDARHAWRAWYKTARWQRLRWSILVRDLFTCRMCRRVEGDTKQLVADHVTPHRGDEALFWSPDNLQCLCKACHDSAKQRIDAARR